MERILSGTKFGNWAIQFTFLALALLVLRSLLSVAGIAPETTVYEIPVYATLLINALLSTGIALTLGALAIWRQQDRSLVVYSILALCLITLLTAGAQVVW